jgi:hypothetical protein
MALWRPLDPAWVQIPWDAAVQADKAAQRQQLIYWSRRMTATIRVRSMAQHITHGAHSCLSVLKERSQNRLLTNTAAHYIIRSIQ